MALPLLDVMRPARTFAALAGVPKNPVRMAFLFVPNGAHMQDWTPLAEGADFDLPYILQPLQAHKSESAGDERAQPRQGLGERRWRWGPCAFRGQLADRRAAVEERRFADPCGHFC
jgi:hypothetical protein